MPKRQIRLIYRSLLKLKRLALGLVCAQTLLWPKAKAADATGAASEFELWPLNQSTAQYSGPRLGAPGVKRDSVKLSLLSESYLNRQNPPAGTTDYNQVGAHLRSQVQGRSVLAVLEVGGSFATGVENYNNLYVPEAFATWNAPQAGFLEPLNMSRARISLGRKLENWTSLDRNWDLGIWEPLNRFDALRPVDQGLTGLFLEASSGSLSAVLFLSQIYIPETQAPFQLNNGSFQSSSPWFSPLPNQLRIGSALRPVRYELQTPATGSIVAQRSIGGLIRGGNPNEGFVAQGAYMFKPRNQLATPFVADLTLTETTNFGRVAVEPVVLNHHVASLDAHYRTQSLSVGVSGLLDVPEDPNLRADLNYQKLETQFFYSPSVELRGQMARTMKWQVALSYLGSTGGLDQAVGPIANGNSNLFSSRSPFREAVQVEGHLSGAASNRVDFNVGAKAIEELSENGSLLMLDFGLSFASVRGGPKDWNVNLMADVLGSELSSSDKRGYTSRFRQNDRVITQLQYVF